MSIARQHHYVPQWYQRQFLSHGISTLFYMDLKPDLINRPGGGAYFRRNILNWGPKRCFATSDLYTLRYGGWRTDIIERQFFGAIDFLGEKAVALLRNFELRAEVNKELERFIHYMDAQRLRTPRGLARLQSEMGGDQQAALYRMRQLFRANATMWSEAVWEIVSAEESEIKFIISDNPVTFFNSKVPPLNSACRYPNDVGLEEVGTRTLFPLSPERCLILTHQQLARDPWRNPRRARTNARWFAPTMMSLLDIQTGRQLSAEEVAKINLILKKRADRYIAAGNKDWLYPEHVVGPLRWDQLDNDWFLMPNLVHVKFGGGMVAQFSDGKTLALDEYGREPDHQLYKDRSLHVREWKSHLRARAEWVRRRHGKARSYVHEFGSPGAYERVVSGILERMSEPTASGPDA